MIPRTKSQLSWFKTYRAGTGLQNMRLGHGSGLRRNLTTATTYTSSDSESNSTITDPAGYCRDLVRRQDYESYLVSQFYPKHLQGGYFALKAFSVRRVAFVSYSLLTESLIQIELATVQDHVTNQMIGKMRMQFWRDAIKGISEVRVKMVLQKEVCADMAT